MKTAKDYLGQPYARVLTPDPEGKGFTAEILEFFGCIAEGDTPDEAYRNLEETAKDWIEVALRAGQEIPEPTASIGYAGKIALRLPRSLHRQAARMAERDGVSLNQFLVSAIAERVGAINLYTRMAERWQVGFAQTTLNLIRMNVSFIGTSPRIIGESALIIDGTTHTKPTSELTLNVIESTEGNRVYA